MPEGLEAIAMAALQHLQGSAMGGKKDSHEAEASGNNPAPQSLLPASFISHERMIRLADNSKGNLSSSLLVNKGAATVESQHRGPSSPAVVSSTSQEEEDEQQHLSVATDHGGDNHAAARVVSFGSVSAAVSAASAKLQQRQEQDVADQVLAVLQSGEAVANISSGMSSDETEDYFAMILADPEKFLIASEPLFSSSLNKTIDRAEIVSDGVQPNDVLCGRGGETNHHTGNIQYRKLVKAYRALYVKSTRRIKPKIAQCIVFAVRQVGGRFLKRNEGENFGDKDSDDGNSSANNATWTDVGNVKAREKTSQALREGAPDLRTAAPPAPLPQDAPTSPSAPLALGASTSGVGLVESPSPSYVPSSSSRPGYNDSAHSQMTAASVSTGNTFSAASASHNNPSIIGKHSLTNHPLFHTLPPFQQHQIMMEELQAAREAAASAEYAALRHYHYQRHQIGHSGNTLPGYNRPLHGDCEMGSTVGGKGIEELREGMQRGMDSKQPHGISGDPFIGHEGLMHQNHLKRVADSLTPSLSQSCAESEKIEKISNSACRGPRLKRLKLRRQLEA
ncbi:hypothetical protein IV203_001569 [Nitzschia inconspicua]|uniref:DUF6824 domain-containing protein n=1 Tax=Nitzschia inconspicua TaxID=303405 RepID=A0A9K3L7F1_9STRA|nr:hypothetical protein IV203_001569 [Nitzschia inconspicua]